MEQGIFVKQRLEQPRNKQADPSRWNGMLGIILVNHYIMGSKEARVCCRLKGVNTVEDMDDHRLAGIRK